MKWSKIIEDLKSAQPLCLVNQKEEQILHQLPLLKNHHTAPSGSRTLVP